MTPFDSFQVGTAVSTLIYHFSILNYGYGRAGGIPIVQFREQVVDLLILRKMIFLSG